MNTVDKYTAIVLAADRGLSDPVAIATKSLCKALSPVGNTPMLFRVIKALQLSQSIDSIIVVGPAKEILLSNQPLKFFLEQDGIDWIDNGKTPCTSAQLAVQQIEDTKPTLITTADHALLNPEMVDYFCQHAADTSADAMLGLAKAEQVVQAYPEVGRTKWKFQDHQYCSCNLFAFRTSRGRSLIEFWKQVEDDRKNPLRIISKLGWRTAIRFVLRQITLNQALQALSTRLSLTIKPVLLPFPEAAIDVDTEQDLRLVEKILEKRSVQG
ncbi:MAG TPA: MobA-like NTP transferase domain containing protein [Crenotrichaceae bacterium]|nr:MobA-like NTP transferase domain containing protein [Crenotrichaceae bacterium]